MVRNQAEPGTGTQYEIFASPPDIGDGNPCKHVINATTWKAGRDYIDTEIGDVCELVEVVGKSSWCSTRSPEDSPPELVFEYERYEGINGNRITVDPNGRDFDPDRFIERWTANPPLGAPCKKI